MPMEIRFTITQELDGRYKISDYFNHFSTEHYVDEWYEVGYWINQRLSEIDEQITEQQE